MSNFLTGDQELLVRDDIDIPMGNIFERLGVSDGFVGLGDCGYYFENETRRA